MKENERQIILLKGLADTYHEKAPSRGLKGALKNYYLDKGESFDEESYNYHSWIGALRKMKKAGFIRRPSPSSGWYITESGLEFLEKKK